MLLLLGAMCVPVFSGALADGDSKPLIVTIEQSTDVYNMDGIQIGTVEPDGAGGSLLRLEDNTEYPNLQVIFDYAAASKTKSGVKMPDTTLVLFQVKSSVETQELASTAGSAMPTEGWIDVALVVRAQSARHEADSAQIATLKDKNAQMENETNPTASLAPVITPGPNPAVGGMFSAERIAIWAPVVALVLGAVGAGALVWMAISVATAALQAERQTKHMTKVADALKVGVAIQTPLQIEQDIWPREGRVPIASESLDQLVEMVRQGAIYGGQYGAQTQQQPEESLPPPVREGEEPELLALANRLAGVASAPEWNSIVKEAGWHAVQLQSNPTEKGTYVVDDSGYSAIACIAYGAEPKLGYIIPSYLDSTASASIWNEFYEIEENESVVNYRIDALSLTHINFGHFYLRKARGRLTRRPRM